MWAGNKLTTFVPEYQDALSKLGVGQVRLGLVKTTYGYHIIKCTELFEVQAVTSLDEVPEGIRTYVSDMLESQAVATTYGEWLTDYTEKAEIELNPMPENVPYNVDMKKALRRRTTPPSRRMRGCSPMTYEELHAEMVAAMKAKDKVRLGVARLVLGELKNAAFSRRRARDHRGRGDRPRSSARSSRRTRRSRCPRRPATMPSAPRTCASRWRCSRVCFRSRFPAMSRGAGREDDRRAGCHVQEGHGPRDGALSLPRRTATSTSPPPPRRLARACLNPIGPNWDVQLGTGANYT